MKKELEKKWLVFYTKSRAEKKALDLLERFGFDAFLPLQTVVRQWSDRKKKVQVPLFNSYIFVYAHESSIPDIVKVPNIAWNIRYNGKPAVIKQEEVEMIQRFLETGYFVETSNFEHLKPGDKVEVADGPLRGMVGILTEEYNEEKFSVVVEAIDQVLTVNIDKKYLTFLSSGTNDSENPNYWS